MDIIRGKNGNRHVLLLRPQLTLDRDTNQGSVKVDYHGWLTFTLRHRMNRRMGHNFSDCVLSAHAIKGPVPVYYALDIEVTLPVRVKHRILFSVLLSTLQTLSKAGKALNYPGILSFIVSGSQRKKLDFIMCAVGNCTRPSSIPFRADDRKNLRRYELGILLDFPKRRLVFVDVARLTVLGRYDFWGVASPLWVLLGVQERARARIRSGKDIHLTPDLKTLINTEVQ